MLERYGDRGELFLGIARIILSLLGLAVMVRLSCTLQKTKVFFLSNKQHIMMHWVEAESREQKCLSLTYLSRRFMGNMRFALRCFLLVWKKEIVTAATADRTYFSSFLATFLLCCCHGKCVVTLLRCLVAPMICKTSLFDRTVCTCLPSAQDTEKNIWLTPPSMHMTDMT